MSHMSKESIYQKAKLGEKIGWGKRPALIVVDFQKGFTMADSPMGGDMTAEVEATKRLADACRSKISNASLQGLVTTKMVLT